MTLRTVLCSVCLAPALLAATHNALLPRPRQVRYQEGRLGLANLSIRIDAASPAAEDRFAAGQLSAALGKAAGRPVPVGQQGGAAVVLKRTGPVAALPARSEKPGPQGRESYRLRITAQGGEITSPSSAGLFYGVQTMIQLVEGRGAQAALPAVEIEDWPDLAYRGVMMDLSHGPLPTPEEIRRQIDFLARWKGNQYYFYSELSIELKGYPLVNPGARYTQDEVRGIIQYARERHVDVVPCLEFYGHLHDLFRLERYADLSPLPHGGEINPRQPRIQALMADWSKQMAALFPSPWFHIGLDEPWELERAGSAAAGGVDPAELYVGHLKHMAGLLAPLGKTVLFWADVASGAALFERYPKLVSELPPGTVAVPWHYHAEKDFTRMVAPFSKAGVPQVIGTGIWAWDTILPNFDVTFANIDGFLADGRKHGTLGIVNTNWSDDAQVLYRATFPGIAYGAAASWQAQPMDRAHFFADYAARLHNPKAAPEVAAGLEALMKAHRHISAALGPEDMFRLWDDPFAPGSVDRLKSHATDLRDARLAAEEGAEHLYNALAAERESPLIPSLLVGAQLIDYAGMKYLYALEIADLYAKLGPSSTRKDISFWLGRQTASRNHSRTADLMDTITELRERYRSAWNSEYRPYRLGSAIGRFDAEYEYWRRFQAKVWELQRSFRDGDRLPPLESLAR